MSQAPPKKYAAASLSCAWQIAQYVQYSPYSPYSPYPIYQPYPIYPPYPQYAHYAQVPSADVKVVGVCRCQCPAQRIDPAARVEPLEQKPISFSV